MKIDKSQLDRVSDQLFWSEELGIGTSPPAPYQLYDKAYWEKYRRYDRTAMGAALTHARLKFVNSYALNCGIVDVGVGGGRFVSEAYCCGYDVNPYARAWLQENGCWLDPYGEKVQAMTFFDSLEHIVDPSPVLRNATDWVFVSVPIHQNMAGLLTSKHFRPGEHVWHFTHRGIVAFMEVEGFELAGASDFETRLGREDIWSFAFKRLVGGCPESSPIA